MEFSVKDYYRTAIETATNGKNTVMYDDYGNPNIMVALHRYKAAHLGLSESLGVHPAFNIGDKEVNEIWISKYPNVIGNGGCGASFYNENNRTPYVTDWDTAYNACKKKGKGWHIITNLEYCALWSMADSLNYSPRRSHDINDGNNSERSSDNNLDGVFVVGGVGEFVDGLRSTKDLRVLWFADTDGNINNDFISRRWTDSGFKMYEDNTNDIGILGGNGRIVFYRPEKNKTYPTLATGRADFFTGCVYEKNGMSKDNDEDLLKAHGLIGGGLRNIGRGFCHLADNTMDMEQGIMSRNVSWAMSPSYHPLTYLLGRGFGEIYTSTFRAVYIDL